MTKNQEASEKLALVAQEKNDLDAKKDEELKTQMITETWFKPKASEKPRYSTGKTMKILPNDRLFLQNLFSSEKYQSFHGISKAALFPGNCRFG